jgi:GT2 family glycosyltransferase
MRMSPPLVSVIIVNWNVSALLDACLTTLRRFTPSSLAYEVLVVDNASTDGSAAMVRAAHPWVTLIASPDNLGFAKANNVGLARASGRYVLYLNPDTELIEDICSPMAAYMEAHRDVGAVGCKLLNTDGTHQTSILSFLRLGNLAREYLMPSRYHGHVRPHPESPRAVEAVLGACLMVRADAARRVGGFDERYFLYQDEIDLCSTLRELGLATVYLPRPAVIHHGSKSSTLTPQIRERALHDNRKSQFLFIQKHRGPAYLAAAALLVGGGLAARLPVLCAVWAMKPSTRARLGSKIRYYSATLRWMLDPRRSSAPRASDLAG